MSYAEEDENGLTPKHWYKFNGSLDSSGATALTISGENGASYTDGVNDQAYLFKSGYHPWGSGMSRGSGDFTVVTVAKTADLDHGIIWAMGTSGTPRGFALVAVGADKVAVRKFGSTWGGEGDIITADVSNATTKYHVYTLVYKNSGCQFSLYVDGETSPSGTGSVSDSATSGFTNSSFQFGSRNGGVNGSSMTQGYGIALDDFRLYQTALTTAQIANIVKTFQTTSVWGNAGSATEKGVATGTNGGSYTKFNVNFGESDNMSQTGIEGFGTVCISKIRLFRRSKYTTNPPETITISQDGVADVVSTSVSLTTSQRVYGPDWPGTAGNYYTTDAFDAVFDSTTEFDTSKPLTISFAASQLFMIQPANSVMQVSGWSPAIEITGVYTENTDPRTFTATLDGTKKWSELEWSPSLPAKLYSRDTLQINVSGTSPTLLMDEAYSSSAKVTFSGAVTVGADESFYEDGCWQKDILAGSSITATSGSISTPELKSGFAGAYSVSSTAISLRAQNKEVISINIAGGSGGGSGADSPTDNIVSGTDYYGIAPTLGDSWNNINRQWQSGGNQTISITGPNAYDGTSVIKRETMSLSATGKNTWQAGISNPFLRGYLDDGNGVTVEVHGVPYTKYDVIVYATSDSAIQLNPITINGTEYTYANGATTPGSTVWGVGLYNTPEIGKNALRVNDCSGEQLTITSKRVVGRGTLCAVQVINKGDVVIKSTYVADVNATTTWNDGNGTGLKKYGSDWINGQLSTLTLTNKATAATLTFDTETEGQILKVVSASGKKLTIPAVSLLNNMSFNSLDFTEANGGVVIDLTGLTAQEQTLISSSVTGTDNVSFTGSVTGFGGYADKSGIYLCRVADLTRKNPVTGEDVANTYAFLGTEDGDWETLANWRKSVDGLLVPYADSTFAPGLRGGDNNIAPELFDGNLISYEAGADGYKNVVADGDPMVDGYNAQYCLVNGVKVSIGHLYGVTSSGGALNFYVDDTSKMIITTGPDTNYGSARTLNMYVAAQDGVVFDQKAYAVASTVNYYFTEFGSVAYNTGVTAGSHAIKRCQVRLGTGADKIVRKQALVTFASSSVNFSWVGLVIDQDDTTVTLKEVAEPPTLADEVGTYCIQQEENGVYITYVVRAPAWEATISTAGSYTLSALDWNTKPFAPKAGDLIAITVTEGVTEQVELTFDDVNITSDTFRVTSPNANVKLTATEKPANISAWQFNGEGYLVYGWPVDALASSHDKVAYAGGSKEGTTIAITHNGGDLRLWGGDWALKESNNAVTTTVEMVDSTVTYSDIFGIGMATYALKGTTAVTTPWLILSQGYLGRESFLTMEDDASIVVTGNTIKDSNQNSVMFGHWDGPSTFTMSGNAKFTAAETIALVGKTANTHTINVNGGTFTAKGIVASAAATGTNTLNLAGGKLVLGEYGISSYSTATKISVNVKGDATITSTAPMQITGLVTIDEGTTLTPDATAGEIKMMGGLVNNGTLKVIGGNVILMDVEDPGTCVTEGTGTIQYGYIVDINSCGKKKIPAGRTWEDMLLFDVDGNSVEITDHDDKYVYFDWKITGTACWWDYEFEGNLTSTGTDTTTMNAEGTTPYYDTDNTALWVGHATPYRGASYPAEFTAVMYGTVVSNATHVMIGFGSTTSTGSGADNPYAISLACGDPVKDEVKLLLSTKFAAQELVTMTVPNAYTSDHLYAFVCTTIDEGGVSKTRIKIYLDGEVLQTYTHSGAIILGSGFQVGSVHGGAPTNYKKATVANEGAFLDFLRLYREILSDAAMREYASRYPYVTKNGFAERTFDGNANWVEAAQWRQVNFDATEQQQAAPNADTVVYVTCDEPAEISLNLTAAANYEQLVIEDGSAAALRRSMGGVVPSVAGVTTVGADLTVDYDAIALGNVTVRDGKTLTFDFASLDISQEWSSSTIVLTKTVTLGEGASIKAINISEAVGRKAELVQNESTGFYELRISVNGTLMANLTDDTAFNDLAWFIGDEPVEPDWTKKVYGTVNVLKDGATLTFDSSLASVATVLTFAGDKGVALAAGDDVTVTGVTYDFAGLDAKATFMYNPDPATVRAGYVRYDLDMGTYAYDKVLMSSGGRYEFKRIRVDGNGYDYHDRTVIVQDGDYLLLHDGSNLGSGLSLDVRGGEVHIGNLEGRAAIAYGWNGTRFNQSGGTVTVHANGTTQSGVANGFVLAHSATGGGCHEFNVTGGLFTVPDSSICFNEATNTINVSGTGIVRAKGAFSAKTPSMGIVNVTDGGTVEIGSLGMKSAACALNVDGGVLRGYETGAAIANVITLVGDTALESSAGADLTVSGGATGEGKLSISEGTVKLGQDSGLGTVAVAVADGATFDLNGCKSENALAVSGKGVGGIGALVNNAEKEGSYKGKLNLAGAAAIGGSGVVSLLQGSDINLAGNVLTIAGKVKLGGFTVASNGGSVVVGSGGTLLSNGATALGDAKDTCDLTIAENGTLDLSGGSTISCWDFTSAGNVIGEQAKLIVNGTLDAESSVSVTNLKLGDGATLSGLKLVVTHQIEFGATLYVVGTDQGRSITIATIPDKDVTMPTTVYIDGESGYTLSRAGTKLIAVNGKIVLADVSLAELMPWVNFESVRVSGTVTGFQGASSGETNINFVVTAGDGSVTTQTFAYASIGGNFAYELAGFLPGGEYQVYAFLTIENAEVEAKSDSASVFAANNVGKWIDESADTYDTDRNKGTGQWQKRSGSAAIVTSAGKSYISLVDAEVEFYPTNVTSTVVNSPIRDISVKASYKVGFAVQVGEHAGVRLATNETGQCRFEVKLDDAWCAVSRETFAPEADTEYEIMVRLDETKGTAAYVLVAKDGNVELASGECEPTGDFKNFCVAFAGTGAIDSLVGECHDTNLCRIYGSVPDQEYPDIDAAVGALGSDAVIEPIWRIAYRLHENAGAFTCLTNELLTVAWDKWYRVAAEPGTEDGSVKYAYCAANNWIEYADEAGVEPMAGGWLVTNEVGLAWLAESATNKWLAGNVALGADLDLSSKNWTPIASFTGTFDGRGHTITGLNNTNVVNDAVLGEADHYYGGTENDWGYTAYGLFGSATNAAFRNVTLADVAISNAADSAAALLGVHAGGDLAVVNVTNASGFVCGEGRAVAGLLTVGVEGAAIGSVVVTNNANFATVAGSLANDDDGGNVAQILAGTTWGTRFEGDVTATNNVGEGAFDVRVTDGAVTKNWDASGFSWLDLPICNFAPAVIMTDANDDFWSYVEANDPQAVVIDPFLRTARMSAGYFVNGDKNIAGWWRDTISAMSDGSTATLEGTGGAYDVWNTVVVDRNITFDLNENCVYGVYDCDVFNVAYGKTLTLKNGSLYYAEGYLPTNGTGRVGLTDVTMTEMQGSFYDRTVPVAALALGEDSAGKFVTLALPFTSANLDYYVDSTTSLDGDVEWTSDVAAEIGTGTPLTIRAPAAGSSGFYRVRIVDPYELAE